MLPMPKKGSVCQKERNFYLFRTKANDGGTSSALNFLKYELAQLPSFHFNLHLDPQMDE